MTRQSPRLTIQTRDVLATLIYNSVGRAGADISRMTGLPSGTIYPILHRLERAGWLKGQWEQIDPSIAGRPRRRFYLLTAIGIKNIGTKI